MNDIRPEYKEDNFILLWRSRVSYKKDNLLNALVFWFHLKKFVIESHHWIMESYREHASSETNIRCWLRLFKDNDFDVNNKACHGVLKKFSDGELGVFLEENLRCSKSFQIH